MIRYEVRCSFCAKVLGGDSAGQAEYAIREHDVTHPMCSTSGCEERATWSRQISRWQIHYCDDHGSEEERRERERQNR